jgi:protease IV
MGKILVGFLAGIGSIILLVVGFFWFLFSDMHFEKKSLPSQFVLHLDGNVNIVEDYQTDAFTPASLQRHIPLYRVFKAMEQALNDPRVVGLMFDMTERPQDLAHLQEIRRIVKRFQEKGKPCFFFADTFGEGSNGLLDYYFASAFHPLWLQPSGEWDVRGLYSEHHFLKGFFKKVGIEPIFKTRGKYKTAPNIFTEDGFTKEHLESEKQLLESFLHEMTSECAAERKKALPFLKNLIDNAPLSAEQALQNGLVDHIGYKDEFEHAIHEKWGEECQNISFKDYVSNEMPRKDEDNPNTIAVVYAQGEIVRGENEEFSLSTREQIGSETLIKGLEEALEDSKVKAIVLRVDSPGGSYIASDSVWNMIEHCKAKGKKVVASMGSYAASGGYFLAMAADHIIAERFSITGSIGVFTGKFQGAELIEKLGIKTGSIQLGANADYESMSRPLSPLGHKKMDENLDRIYTDFITKASKSRKMTVPELHALAQGRVWSGMDAHKHKLVDELGGFMKALNVAQKLAKIEQQKVNIVTYPKAPSFAERVLQYAGDLEGLASLSVKISTFSNNIRSLTGVDLTQNLTRENYLKHPSLPLK